MTQETQTIREAEHKAGISFPTVLRRRIKNMLLRNSGPVRASNCWNTTRKLFGDKVPFEWEYYAIMEKWLEKETKEVSAQELQPFDIVAFRSDRLDHTVLYLGNGIVFHKSGECPFEFATLCSVERRYYFCYLSYHRHKKGL